MCWPLMVVGVESLDESESRSSDSDAGDGLGDSIADAMC